MNLVAGATGSLGGQVCRLLIERGDRVRALVRASSDTAKVQQLRALGAEIVVADLTDAASLALACSGIETVISTATAIASQRPTDSLAGTDDAGHRALIDAAKTAGVDHFVYVSISGGIKVACPLVDAKRNTEAWLVQSGLAYTVLRATPFMETWLGPATGWDHAQRTAVVLGSGDQRISYVAEGDVARFVAASVRLRGARNRIVEIGGPDAFSPSMAVTFFEQTAGARYTVQPVPLEALQAQYAAAAQPTQKSFAGLMLALAGDDIVPMAATAREFGIALQSLGDVARRMVPVSA
jgi:uncharacterized protein YbjT (DUF2867 family)